MTVKPGTYSIEETRVRLGVSRATAYKGVRDGTIPAIRIAGCWRVLIAPLERVLTGESPTPRSVDVNSG